MPTNIELEDSFADASLEMDGTDRKFRVAQALQDTIASNESRIDALEGGGGGSWGVATNINPRHYYRATDVLQSGGLVDQLTDSGRVPKHFTQTGSLRAPTALDANGKQYLALDGSGKRYTAGVASDWTWLSNGAPWTIGLVVQRTPVRTVDGTDCELATMTWSSSSVGMYIGRGWGGPLSAGGPTRLSTIECGVQPFHNTFVCAGRLNVTAEIWVVTVVHFGFTWRQYSGGWTSFGNGRERARSIELWKNGALVSANDSAPDAVYNPNPPAGPLTLGAFTNGAEPSASRVFEVFVEDRALPTDDVQQYARDASKRFAFTLAA